jgi:hypothetical protein
MCFAENSRLIRVADFLSDVLSKNPPRHAGALRGEDWVLRRNSAAKPAGPIDGSRLMLSVFPFTARWHSGAPGHVHRDEENRLGRFDNSRHGC